MFEYEADPNHPEAHPLYDDSKVKDVVFDPKDLTPDQIKFEERRARRKADMKAKRLTAEAEELEKNGGVKEKIHKRYASKNALITRHDFDGTPEYCTECTAPLWGTEFVLPLWRRCRVKHALLTHPYCEGCYRLFSDKWCKNLADKYKIILWMLTGEAENLKNDVDVRDRAYDFRSELMRERALKMTRAIQLYDHPSWTFLKSIDELIYEYHHAYPSTNNHGIQMQVSKFLEEDEYVKKVSPKPIDQIEIASGEQLRQLVIKREGRDALLGHRCCIRKANTFNGLTFDHLEPCSHARYAEGTYSIGNLQILSRCINQVKGHYTEREVVRWLIRILECYEKRYEEDHHSSLK